MIKKQYYKANTKWLFCNSISDMFRDLKVKVEVNDEADIFVLLQPKHHDVANARNIYYFEKGSLVDEANKLP